MRHALEKAVERPVLDTADLEVLQPFWPQDMDPKDLLQLHPLPAGVYDVRVLPGRDWPMRGHGNQNINKWGTARSRKTETGELAGTGTEN